MLVGGAGSQDVEYFSGGELGMTTFAVDVINVSGSMVGVPERTRFFMNTFFVLRVTERA